MLRLLSIEFFKLQHNRASKILIIIYFGLLASIALVSSLKIELGFFSIKLAEQGIFEFPYIWHFSTYFSALFKFFLLLVIVSMVSNEYSNKTIKQNLIDGLSKREYVLSKFYMVVLMSLASTLFVFIVSLVLGVIFSTEKGLDVILTDLSFFIAFFVKLLSFFSLGLFMGVWIQRSAFAMGGIFILFIGEAILGGILGAKFSADTADFITSLMPLNSGQALIVSPLSRMETVQQISTQMGSSYNFDYGVPMFNLGVSSLWVFIFVYGSYALINKRDL